MALRNRREPTRIACTPSGSFQSSAWLRNLHIALSCARNNNGTICSAGAEQSSSEKDLDLAMATYGGPMAAAR
jgi:hypothetical protein